MFLSFDDGAAVDVKVLDLLAKHNLTATFYIPAYWESYNSLKGWKPLSFTQVKEIADNHELGSHTITHPLLTRIPYAVAEYEIKESKKMLEDWFGKKVDRFSYPRGYATDPIKDIVRKHYAYARSTLVGNITTPDDPAWENTTVHLACPRREYNQESWYDYGLRHLKMAARRKNGYFHAWGHSWEIQKYNAWDAVDRFLGAIKGAMDDLSS